MRPTNLFFWRFSLLSFQIKIFPGFKLQQCHASRGKAWLFSHFVNALTTERDIPSQSRVVEKVTQTYRNELFGNRLNFNHGFAEGANHQAALLYFLKKFGLFCSPIQVEAWLQAYDHLRQFCEIKWIQHVLIDLSRDAICHCNHGITDVPINNVTFLLSSQLLPNFSKMVN